MDLVIRELMDDIVDDPHVGEITDYTDMDGITHVHVLDSNQDFQLINGEWVEIEPF